jgi:transposase
MDLRERVVAAVKSGMSCNRAAKQFGVGISTAINWMKRLRETGGVAPGKMGGHKPKKIAGEHRCSGSRAVTSLCVGWWWSSPSAVSRSIIARSGISFIPRSSASKKSLVAGERDRPDVARRRAQWTKYQDRVEPERLVFIDETWTKTNMAPLRGWAPCGKRLVAKVPHRRWKTTTFVAALRLDRIDAPWLLEGPIDGESFRTYVERVLVPTLREGDIVIMDNLGSHKGKAVRDLIRSAGAKPFFLPKYSPDLNPIEQVFAKLKHLLRKSAPQSAKFSEPSPPKNAPTISETQAT